MVERPERLMTRIAALSNCWRAALPAAGWPDVRLRLDLRGADWLALAYRGTVEVFATDDVPGPDPDSAAWFVGAALAGAIAPVFAALPAGAVVTTSEGWAMREVRIGS